MSLICWAFISAKTAGEIVCKCFSLCQPGDRVYAVRSLSGAYAEFAVADENMVCHLDDKLTFEQGAGVGIPCYTAYRAVVTKYVEYLAYTSVK